VGCGLAAGLCFTSCSLSHTQTPGNKYTFSRTQTHAQTHKHTSFLSAWREMSCLRSSPSASARAFSMCTSLCGEPRGDTSVLELSLDNMVRVSRDESVVVGSCVCSTSAPQPPVGLLIPSASATSSGCVIGLGILHTAL
jgi:hypothetical protein